MKHPILAAVCALSLLLTGCSSAIPSQEENTTETMVVYKALPLPDLFVDIPEGYAETSSEFYEKYYIQDDASIIITEDNNAPKGSIKDYSTRALVQYQGMTHTLEVTGSDTIYVGSMQVEILEFTYTLGEDTPALSTLVSYASDGATVYIITCKCAAENYDAHRDEFLAVVNSMRVDKTPQKAPTAPPVTEAAT